ncbi:MAG: DUF748 domain-containing protein [Myxococcota bacterium]
MARVSKKKKVLIVLGVLCVLLIGLRLALPTIVKKYVNHLLATNPDYHGHVDDIDIALLRGAYVINRVVITKVGGTSPIPFLEIDSIDLSVEWKALFDGALVAEVEVHRPRVNFVNGATAASDQAGAEVDWRKQVKDLVPLEINRFAVYDGDVHYVEFPSENATKPSIDLRMTELRVEAYNLTNSQDLAGTLVATVDASGRPLDLGDLKVHAVVDPYADAPTFDLDAQLQAVPVTRLNEYITKYALVDVEAGTMEIYAELAASNGAFDGYVKPMFADMKVFSLKKEVEEDKDGPLRLAWEALVGGAKGVLQNDKTGRVALKVPLSGKLDNPKVGAWPAVFSAVGNAFIEALFRGLDHEVSMNDVVGPAPEAEPKEKKKGLFGKK